MAQLGKDDVPANGVRGDDVITLSIIQDPSPTSDTVS